MTILGREKRDPFSITPDLTDDLSDDESFLWEDLREAFFRAAELGPEKVARIQSLLAQAERILLASKR